MWKMVKYDISNCGKPLTLVFPGLISSYQPRGDRNARSREDINEVRQVRSRSTRRRTRSASERADTRHVVGNASLMARDSIDNVDRAILRELWQQADIPRLLLCKRIGMQSAGLSKRLKRLEGLGFIRRYTIDIDFERVDLSVAATLLVQLNGGQKEFEKAVTKMASVVEVVRVFGHYDYLLKVVCDTNLSLMDITQDIISLEEVKDSQTLVMAKQIKSDVSGLFV